jgi:hypothetical protein
MMIDPVGQSVGGLKGHVMRRLFHLSMAFIPWIFYQYGDEIGVEWSISKERFASLVVLVIIIGESLRLKLGFVVFGQRQYEATQISALAWGGFSVGLVLLMFEEAKYGYPLIFSLTFIDPLLGEARRMGLDKTKVKIIGIAGAALIWLLCWHLVATPLVLVAIMAPLVVAAESPRLKWIDDNATMLLIPAAAMLIISVWL